MIDNKQKQSIGILVRAYYDAQHERTRIDGQLGQTKKGEIKKGVPERDTAILAAMFKRRETVFAYEEELIKSIAEAVKLHPLWDAFLKDVKGVGPGIAGVIISEFDINKSQAVSNMWSFAGLAPGKDRLVKGKKATFNKFLRSKLCGVLGSSFLKSKSEYSEFYYNMKNRLEQKDWGNLSPNPTNKNRPKAGHQHNAANRYMIKMFLRDLYVSWRTLANLPVRKPYEEEYLDRKHHEKAS
jgi:hypothetical protein